MFLLRRIHINKNLHMCVKICVDVDCVLHANNFVTHPINYADGFSVTSKGFVSHSRVDVGCIMSVYKVFFV